MKRTALVLSAFLLGTACTKTPESAPSEPATKQAARAPGSYRIYVTNENSGDVSVIDSASMEVVATIPVGKRPRGVRASLDGKTIFVALSGSPAAPPGVDESTLPPPDKSADGVGLIDATTDKVVRTIKCGSDPEQFDISKDGKLIFVSNEDDAKTSVVEIESGKLLGDIKVGDEPEGVTTSPDGKFVYVTSEDSGTVTAFDPVTRKVLKTIKVGRRPRSVAFLPDGSRAYVTNENDGNVTLIDSVRHTAIKSIKLGEAGKIKPMGLALSEDGAKLYVSTGRGKMIFVVDTSKNEPEASFEVGVRPWGIALAPDGQTLFAADGPAGSLAVVDIPSRTVVKKIKCGDSPWGVITLAN